MNDVAVQQLPKLVEFHRIVAVRFVESVDFAAESTNVVVGASVDSVTPARLEETGRPVPIAANQRADGLLLVRRVHDRLRGRYLQEKAFVPMSNIRSIKYGE